jgi:succinate dehydrogenase/fumarate reductase flavoprotein subunit
MKQEENETNKISRRQFVTGAAASVAAVTLVGCAPKVAATEAPTTAASTEAPTTAATAADTAAAPTAAAPQALTAEIASGKWAFEIPPAPIADADIANTVEADLIVVGSGISGLVTANSALENGAKVIVISASKAVTYRGGSFHAPWSKAMEAAGVQKYDVDKFFRRELSAASYRVDQDKWWKFYNNSPEAMNWLIDIMEAAGFKTVLEHDNKEENDGPSNAPIGAHSWINDKMTMACLGAQFVAETLSKKFTDAGGQLIFETAAKQLVREDNNTGRVSAVIAQGADGKYTKYTGTKAIVLATGDFSADREMMAKYCPWALPLLNDQGDQGYNNNFKFGGLFKGDGQKMGLWIGAAWQKNANNPPMIQGKWIASNQPYGAHRGLLMNKNGVRYGNEDVNGPYAGIAQMGQPDMASFAIWDQAYLQNGAPWYGFGMVEGAEPMKPEDIQAQWDQNVKSGAYIKADTIDEIISKLGLPADVAKKTIDHYNELATAGEDTDFHKRKALLAPITTAPFYGAATALPDFLTVMGGLRTNINMQVCDDKDQPIAGLFNVGTMIGDYYANCYNFNVAGNNYGAGCLTFGYLTGRAIAKGEL